MKIKFVMNQIIKYNIRRPSQVVLYVLLPHFLFIVQSYQIEIVVQFGYFNVLLKCMSMQLIYFLLFASHFVTNVCSTIVTALLFLLLVDLFCVIIPQNAVNLILYLYSKCKLVRCIDNSPHKLVRRMCTVHFIQHVGMLYQLIVANITFIELFSYALGCVRKFCFKTQLLL